MCSRWLRRHYVTRKLVVAVSVVTLLICTLRLLRLDSFSNVDLSDTHKPQTDELAKVHKLETGGPVTSCVGSLCDNVGQLETTIDKHGFKWCQELLGLPRPNVQVEPQVWQNVDGRNLTVFSSYLDARTNVVGSPIIRVVASGLQASFNEIGELFCHIWYRDSDIPLSFGPAAYDLIYPSTLHGEMWVAHFVLCQLPSANQVPGTPFAVSVTGQRCSTKTGNQLMVKTLEQQQLRAKKPSFALCLPVTYGR
jgi:hypothetical protein